MAECERAEDDDSKIESGHGRRWERERRSERREGSRPEGFIVVSKRRRPRWLQRILVGREGSAGIERLKLIQSNERGGRRKALKKSSCVWGHFVVAVVSSFSLRSLYISGLCRLYFPHRCVYTPNRKDPSFFLSRSFIQYLRNL